MRALVLLPLLVLLPAAPAGARDYGQHGAVFPIVERDLLEQIRERLVAMEKSGETGRLNQELKRRTIARVSRPEPVAGLIRAEAPRRWTIDPTVTLDADIRGAKGELIHPAGTRINPLDSVGLRSELIFLDGDDPEQIAWALARKEPAKLILVKGAPLELMRARQRRFYFDQGGKLVAHFRVRAVPALVRQRGRQLEVSEIALPSRNGARP